MFCSTVIATIGRAELSRAVESVLTQPFTRDAFEVIVVNDSGEPLRPASWQRSERVTVINTQRRERCVARNAGAAIARGRHLNFLDDDDWLLPEAFDRLWKLAQTTPAPWLVGASQLVDRTGRSLITLRHNLPGNCFVQLMAGEWIPLQASLIDAAAFFAAGGFNPLIPGIEDIDLGRRLALAGEVAFAATPVACIGMGEENSSTNRALTTGYSRRARETILNRPGVFARMRVSATSPFWRGRMARAYLTSVVWNARRKNMFTAAGRAWHGLASLALAGSSLLSIEFWRAVAHPYRSQTFERGFDEVARPVAGGEIYGV
ncbi:MAG: glycosyltransferase family 2 protein [Anaerolineae bacterium]